MNVLGNFPLIIGEWRGERSAVDEKVYRILETDMVMVNRYTDGRDLINLTTVYFPEAKVDFHAPEACNRGQGDTIESLGIRSITLRNAGKETPLTMNAFTVLRSDGRRDLFCYFYRSGDFSGSSYLNLRLKMAMRLFSQRETSGAMVVISTRVKDRVETAERLIDEFLTSVYPTLLRYV
jgi:EpsI family protein